MERLTPERTIPLFLYGTLRTGGRRHGLVAPYLVSAIPARAWGRLYQLPAGYPALEVPAESVRALGTCNPETDAETADRYTADRVEEKSGDWGWVQGELAILEAPERSLPPIDAYEDFRPGRECLYQRVLIVVVTTEGNRTAWTYARRPDTADVRIPDGTWRGKGRVIM